MIRPVAVAGAVLLTACEVKPLQFTAGAVESLPQHAAAAGGLTSGKSIAGETQLAKFFRQECHQHPDVNYCPPGVDVKANGGLNDAKFTVTTLLGLVYHAELYLEGHRTRCAGTPKTFTRASLVGLAQGGDDPGRYVLDQLALYECLETDVHDGATKYVAASVQPDFQATLATRHKAPSGPGGPPQTDVFQIDVSLDAQQAPTFLAFNWAGVSSMAGRAVLLVNLTTHRFAVKYLTGPAGQEHFVSALGVGGVDRATGAGHPGFYRARYSSEQRQPQEACVDNATQLLEVDDTECRAAGVPITWAGSEAVAGWLAMSAGERARLAPWLAKFEDPGPLPLSDTPSDRADADRYFPARIE